MFGAVKTFFIKVAELNLNLFRTSEIVQTQLACLPTTNNEPKIKRLKRTKLHTN